MVSFLFFMSSILFLSIPLWPVIEGYRKINPDVLVFPFLMIGIILCYIFWNYRTYWVPNKKSSAEKNVNEYKKNLNYESIQSIIVGGLIFTTLSVPMNSFEPRLLIALFLGGVLLFSFIIGINYIKMLFVK